MANVSWGVLPAKENFKRWSVLGMLEPDRLLPLLAKERKTSGEVHYLMCPAFQEAYKNTFVVRSPFDLVMTVTPHRTLLTDRFGQDFYDAHVINRAHEIGADDPLLVSCNLLMYFVPDVNCTMEVMPAHMHSTPLLQNTRVVVGMFDAHAWPRSIDFAFEVVDESKPIVFKRGEPLFYLRFTPSDGSKVSLQYVSTTPDMENALYATADLKNRVPKLSLKEMYTLAKRINKTIFHKRKCPFNFIRSNK